MNQFAGDAVLIIAAEEESLAAAENVIDYFQVNIRIKDE